MLLKTSQNNKRDNIFGGLFSSQLACAFSRRSDGNMSLSYGDASRSLDNRRIFLGRLGIDCEDLVCAKQVHDASVRYADITDKGKGAVVYDDAIADTDAFITDKKNIPITIFTADCLSVFIYDIKTPAIGIVHAGWRSTKENIVLRAINLMEAKFNTRADDLYVGFGPAIGRCCYEVSADFNSIFPGFVRESGDKYYFDLVGVNKNRLLGAGIKQENIFDSCLCTSCKKEDCFSFRREGSSCGRIMSVMMLK